VEAEATASSRRAPVQTVSSRACRCRFGVSNQRRRASSRPVSTPSVRRTTLMARKPPRMRRRTPGHAPDKQAWAAILRVARRSSQTSPAPGFHGKRRLTGLPANYVMSEAKPACFSRRGRRPPAGSRGSPAARPGSPGSAPCTLLRCTDRSTGTSCCRRRTP